MSPTYVLYMSPMYCICLLCIVYVSYVQYISPMYCICLLYMYIGDTHTYYIGDKNCCIINSS